MKQHLFVGQSKFDWIVQTRNLDTTPLSFAFTGQELNPPINETVPVPSSGSATINKVVYSENTVTNSWIRNWI